jgi:hypothetical protein
LKYGDADAGIDGITNAEAEADADADAMQDARCKR